VAYGTDVTPGIDADDTPGIDAKEVGDDDTE
jgi:hypothetical protein